MTGRPVAPSTFTSDQRLGVVVWNGRGKNNVSSIALNNYPSAGGSGGFSDTEVQPLPAPNGWLLTAVARSNPSRPVVTVPEMAQNIVQLPKLLRDTWKVLRHPGTLFSPKGVANNFLMVKFGWKPMIEDILKLLDAKKEIEKRSQLLNRLYSGKGLRRRITLGTDTLVKASSSDLALSGPSSKIRLHHTQTCVKSSWATVRWKPLKPPLYRPGDSGYTAYVRNLVLGFTPEGLAHGLWKIIPWTWLIGWFTNIGDYLMAFSNTVPATWTEACLMRKSTVTTSGTHAQGIGAEVVGIYPSSKAVRTIRTRVVGGTVLLPGFNVPFLGASQLSVLAALGVQRLRVFK